MKDLLKLRAADPEDITIFSSLLQDAIIRVRDITWQPDLHSFIVVANRFCWEEKKSFWPFKKKHSRINTALQVNGILGVKTNGYDTQDNEAFLNLLNIHYEAIEDNECYIRLDFSAGATIQLHCECIDVILSDTSESWHAIGKPDHI